MKFNSFDELINFLHGKDLSALEFNITGLEPVDGECTGDCEVGADGTEDPSVVPVSFASFSDKPVMEFETGEVSTMLVESFEHIPGTCSTTKINLFGREVTIGVCENTDGLPVAKFDVIIEGKMHSSKEFILVTDATKFKNTITL